jgi:hypothetical protein
VVHEEIKTLIQTTELRLLLNLNGHFINTCNEKVIQHLKYSLPKYVLDYKPVGRRDINMGRDGKTVEPEQTRRPVPQVDDSDDDDDDITSESSQVRG